MFMISTYKIFSIMFLGLFYVYYKGKNQLFFNLYFLLLLNEKRLSPESCSPIRHPPMAGCLLTGCL